MKPNDYLCAAKAVYLNFQADFVDILKEGYKNTDLELTVNKEIRSFVANLELLVQCILLHIGLSDNDLSDNEKSFIYEIANVKNSLMAYIRAELGDDSYELENISKQNEKNRIKFVESIDEIVLNSVDKIATLLAPILKKDKDNEIYNISLDRLFFISEMFMKCDGQSTQEAKSVAETINKLYAIPLLSCVENYNKQ